jgi:hypothetical protein
MLLSWLFRTYGHRKDYGYRSSSLTVIPRYAEYTPRQPAPGWFFRPAERASFLFIVVTRLISGAARNPYPGDRHRTKYHITMYSGVQTVSLNRPSEAPGVSLLEVLSGRRYVSK